MDVLTLNPFNPEQVFTFVSNWYLSIEILSQRRDDAGVHQRAEKGARDLMRRIHSSDTLVEFATNPLLLTMIATVHRYRGALPDNRAALYREICEVFLGKLQDVRGVEKQIDLSPAQKQCVLELLAYRMMCEQIVVVGISESTKIVEPILREVGPNIEPRNFLSMIESTSSLLLEKESGEYMFAHKTFQEYLAAVHCRNERLEAELIKHVNETRWHETIRLYAAQSDATPILEACLKGNLPSAAAIMLAVDCESDGLKVDPRWREQLERVLMCEHGDEALHKEYALTRLALRLRGMNRIAPMENGQRVDSSLVTQMEYQAFLDEMRAREKYYQPDYWTSYRFPPGEGAKPVVGVRVSDAEAFCQWLTEEKGESAWRYRLPYSTELDMGMAVSTDSQGNLGTFGYWVNSPNTNQSSVVFLSSQARKELMEQLKKMLALGRASSEDRRDADVFAQDRALTIDLFHALNAAQDRVLARAPTFDFDNISVLDRTLNRVEILDLLRTFDHAYDLDLSRALAAALDIMQDRAHIRANNLANDRSKALLVATGWMYVYRRLGGQLPKKASIFGWFSGIRAHTEGAAALENIKNYLNSLLDFFVLLTILEGQIQGHISTKGGIRIVRERWDRQQSSKN